MARLTIVEDHELVAQTLAAALRMEGHDVTVVIPHAADEVLGVVQASGPEVVLLDFDLGLGEGLGLALIAPLTAAGARVVMVTGNRDRAALGACMESGAVGVVSKAQSFDDLIANVSAAIAGDRVMPESERFELLEELRSRRAKDRELRAPFESLTPRETEVLQELMDGHSAEAIAAAGFTSVATVRTQIAAVLRKLDVSSQLAAVGLARRSGFPNF
jgi:DNA-binding NarL/FixJ family response regulator